MPKTAVIMMTAFGTPEMSDAALRIGAYRVVPKPFEVHDIAALVLEAHAPLRYFFTLKLKVTVSTNEVGMPFSTSGE